MLGARKHDRQLTILLGVEAIDEEGALVFALHETNLLRHIFGRGGLRRDGDGGGIVENGMGEIDDWL